MTLADLEAGVSDASSADDKTDTLPSRSRCCFEGNYGLWVGLFWSFLVGLLCFVLYRFRSERDFPSRGWVMVAFLTVWVILVYLVPSLTWKCKCLGPDQRRRRLRMVYVEVWMLTFIFAVLTLHYKRLYFSASHPVGSPRDSKSIMFLAMSSFVISVSFFVVNSFFLLSVFVLHCLQCGK